MDYSSKKILILGLGLSGRSMVQFFLDKRAEVLAYDDKADEISFDLCSKVSIISDDELKSFDLIALSPGVDPNHILCKKANNFKIEIIGEIEIGLLELNCKVIAITGTNGKSTVTKLITHILNDWNIKALALGNIGLPITSCINQLQDSIAVIELSSFQIDCLKSKSIDIGIILNVTPDHLDRYQNFEGYRNSKLSMAYFIKEGGTFYLPQDLLSLSKQEKVRVQAYDEKKLELKPIKSIRDKNLNAALKICQHFSLTKEQILKSIESFEPLEHRFEFVKNIDGVNFINDSKATNLESLFYALENVDGQCILIMGGKDKGFNFSKCIKPFNSKVKKIYVLGESLKRIKEALEINYEINECKNLDEAVKRSFNENANKICILFSPGCSSYDMFKNFSERGEEFKKCVNDLSEVKL